LFEHRTTVKVAREPKLQAIGGLLDRSAGAKERSVRPSQAWEEGMSWHTSALVIEGDHARRGPDLFEDLGFPGLAEVSEVSGDEAGRSALQGRALGLVRGWTFVWDPMMFFVPGEHDGAFQSSIWSARLETALLVLSRDGRIYSFIAEGTSGTHGFAWYVQGQRKRLWLQQEGTLIMQHGGPLPEEVQAKSGEPDAEYLLFLMMEKLTGVSIGDVFSHQFKVFEALKTIARD